MNLGQHLFNRFLLAEGFFDGSNLCAQYNVPSVRPVCPGEARRCCIDCDCLGCCGLSVVGIDAICFSISFTHSMRCVWSRSISSFRRAWQLLQSSVLKWLKVFLLQSSGSLIRPRDPEEAEEGHTWWWPSADPRSMFCKMTLDAGLFEFFQFILESDLFIRGLANNTSSSITRTLQEALLLGVKWAL